MDTSYQSILWGKLLSKSSDFALLVAVCYRPPGRSVWADSDAFFNTATSQVQYQNEGCMVIGGDFNAQCGNNDNYIEGAGDFTP